MSSEFKTGDILYGEFQDNSYVIKLVTQSGDGSVEGINFHHHITDWIGRKGYYRSGVNWRLATPEEIEKYNLTSEPNHETINNITGQRVTKCTHQRTEKTLLLDFYATYCLDCNERIS